MGTCHQTFSTTDIKMYNGSFSPRWLACSWLWSSLCQGWIGASPPTMQSSSVGEWQWRLVKLRHATRALLIIPFCFFSASCLYCCKQLDGGGCIHVSKSGMPGWKKSIWTDPITDVHRKSKRPSPNISNFPVGLAPPKKAPATHQICRKTVGKMLLEVDLWGGPFWGVANQPENYNPTYDSPCWIGWTSCQCLWYRLQWALHEHVFKPKGFVTALYQVLNVRQGGGLTLAPVCSSWVWVWFGLNSRKLFFECINSRFTINLLSQPSSHNSLAWGRGTAPNARRHIRWGRRMLSASKLETSWRVAVQSFYWLQQHEVCFGSWSNLKTRCLSTTPWSKKFWPWSRLFVTASKWEITVDAARSQHGFTLDTSHLLKSEIVWVAWVKVTFQIKPLNWDYGTPRV